MGRRDVSIVVRRVEYANLFHVLTEVYGAWLTARLHGRPAQSAAVILADTHPTCPLDAFYERLFGRVDRVPGFDNGGMAVEAITGYLSPLNPAPYPAIGHPPPLLDEFIDDVMRAFDVDETERSTSSNIVFVSRQPYVAHPGNPTGRISRRVCNESELLATISLAYPTANVVSLRMETLSIAEQLTVVRAATVLMGMHGAGLSHSLFLRPGALGVVEFFPTYHSMASNHFSTFCAWRGVRSWQWQNLDLANEVRDAKGKLAEVTLIPPSVALEGLRALRTPI